MEDHNAAMVACSSATDHSLDATDTFMESFGQEETAVVGLDSLCSRDIFYSKSDFVTKIEPIKPFSIQGIGGNIKAISICKVWFRFKILDNVYYAPKSPVCIISIPQLARDTKEASSF